ATLQTERLEAAGLPGDVDKGCLPVSATFAFEVGELEREGKYLLRQPGDADLASPIHLIGQPRAPFHVNSGEKDLARCMAPSRAAVERFRRNGWAVTSAELPEANHFDAHLKLLEPQTGWLDRLAAMLAA